jgi:hypothetical protein
VRGVRCAVYMGALSAIRHNPEIRAFYKRLRDAGKPEQLAHIAADRKIIVILNANLRDAKIGLPFLHSTQLLPLAPLRPQLRPRES